MTNTCSTHGAGALLSIDLAAICDNWRLLRAKVGPADGAAVVKADAYGLGASQVGPALAGAGCKHFFVAHLDEGLALRPHLPGQATVYVMHGLPPGAEAECAAHGLVPVLNSRQQIDAWRDMAISLGRRLPAIVQVDSGMARLGLSAPELQQLAREPSAFDGIAVAYVMSHLACADEPDHPANAAQRENFVTARRGLPAAPATFANSSGIFLGPAYHFELARPGAALYGVAPVPGQPNPMRPVVRLQGKVIQTRTVAAGAAVGYGFSWVAPHTSRIATVSVGYADGYLRSLSGRGAAWLDGAALPLVGRVSMDTITVDITALPEEAIGPATLLDLLSPQHTVDEMAARAGTIGYEILTSLGSRYERSYG
ncbi:MAG: alanine racemase [Rhodoferax sp.]